MALTYLFSELVSKNLLPGLRVKAYIVDHQYRAESTREAHTVAKWVKGYGRNTRHKLLVIRLNSW